jgi:diaminopimelate epimerase
VKLPFVKMHGAGNDYVYVNGFSTEVADPVELAKLVSPRRTGIGSDGLILVRPSDVADCRMEMYNADGSRGLMCGNGIRCVGKLAWDDGLTRANPMRVETDCGVKTLELVVEHGRVVAANVDMGEPILEPARIPVRFDGERMIDQPIRAAGGRYTGTAVSMGNPHFVIFLPEVDGLDLERIGPSFERHEIFPERVNTEFSKVLSPSEARMRVWERGSGETAACGTGACAAVVAGVLTGRLSRKTLVHLNGGDLEIEWRESDGHVFMRGEAVEVFRGEIEIPG